MASTLWCVDQYVRVLLYESFFHSGIIKLARQPYVLECFACVGKSCAYTDNYSGVLLLVVNLVYLPKCLLSVL